MRLQNYFLLIKFELYGPAVIAYSSHLFNKNGDTLCSNYFVVREVMERQEFLASYPSVDMLRCKTSKQGK